MLKRTFQFLLALTMAICMLSMAAYAAEPTSTTHAATLKVGDVITQYATLQEAIDAVGTKGTITMVTDVRENIHVVSGKSFTLNMEGHTINGGTAANTAALTVDHGATVKLNGTGHIIREDDGGEGYHVIINRGYLALGNSTIAERKLIQVTNNAAAAMIVNLSTSQDVKGELFVYGGDYDNGTHTALVNAPHGYLYMTGGRFGAENGPEGDQASSIENWGTAYFACGEYYGNIWTIANPTSPAQTAVTGDLFCGDFILAKEGDTTSVPTLKLIRGAYRCAVEARTDRFSVNKGSAVTGVTIPSDWAWSQSGDLIAVTNAGRTLSLSGEIFINQYVSLNGLSDPDYVTQNGGLLIWTSPVEAEQAVYGNEDEHRAGLISTATQGEYAQQTGGIAAREYADELYLRVYVRLEDGTYVYSPLDQYSVQAYCEGRLAHSSNEKLKETCAALLHYGAAAQTYFHYNTDDMANANILASRPAAQWDPALLTPLAPVNTQLTGTGDVQSNGRTLSLNGELFINNYFAPTTDWTVTGGTLQVWSGVTEELTEANISYTVPMIHNTGNEWAAQSRGIVAKAYGETIFVRACLMDNQGQAHYSDVTAYSAEAYAAGRIERSTNPDMVELVKKLVIYGECAKGYFGG